MCCPFLTWFYLAWFYFVQGQSQNNNNEFILKQQKCTNMTDAESEKKKVNNISRWRRPWLPCRAYFVNSQHVVQKLPSTLLSPYLYI